MLCSGEVLWSLSPPEYELLYPAGNPACPLYYSFGGDLKDWEPEVSLEQDLNDDDGQDKAEGKCSAAVQPMTEGKLGLQTGLGERRFAQVLLEKALALHSSE